MAGANTLNFTDAGWDTEVLKSPEPVLVDFWATWCGPCRQMTPIIDQLADEYHGKARIGKLNVDDNGQTAMRYQVRGIPTLLLFKGGQVVATKVGATGKSDVQKMLDAHIVAADPAPVVPKVRATVDSADWVNEAAAPAEPVEQKV